MNVRESGDRVQIAIAIVEHRGRYLIGLRPEGTPLSGYWEFPGGKVRVGELPAEAAVRECLEETGLAVRVTAEYPQATHDYEHAAVRLHFFACEPLLSPPYTLPLRLRWVSPAQLADYKFPPANAAMLVQLQAMGR
jgi:mutator protein MutT